MELKLTALFDANIGWPESEICALGWQWEMPYPAPHSLVFVIRLSMVKTREHRVVVFNRPARQILGEVRGGQPEHVFTCEGDPLKKTCGSVCKRARLQVGRP